MVKYILINGFSSIRPFIYFYINYFIHLIRDEKLVAVTFLEPTIMQQMLIRRAIRESMQRHILTLIWQQSISWMEKVGHPGKGNAIDFPVETWLASFFLFLSLQKILFHL